MNRLEELIFRCCPNGVPYLKLDTVCDIGKGVQFNKSDMQEEGSYPVINGGVTLKNFQLIQITQFRIIMIKLQNVWNLGEKLEILRIILECMCTK